MSIDEDGRATMAGEVERVLREIGLFAALPEPTLRRVAEAMQRLDIADGDALVRQGEVGDAMFVLVRGSLRVLQRGPDGHEALLGHVGPGQTVGEIQLAVGGARSATLVAEGACELLRLSSAAFDALGAEEPRLVEALTATVKQRLYRSRLAAVLPKIIGPTSPEIIAEFERRATWVTLPRGEALFHQGDEGDACYIVASGWLRVVQTDAQGRETVLNEVGRGESLGELALITGSPRSATPYAVRDSELIRLWKQDFEDVMTLFPRALLAITGVLARRMQRGPDARRKSPNLNIAVVPSRGGAPSGDIAAQLAAQLARFGPTLHLSARRLAELSVMRDAARVPEGHPHWLRLAAWLDEQEAAHRFVVLEADDAVTGWTRRVIGRADHLVIVADATRRPALGEVEAEVLDGADDRAHARRTLLLVHPHNTMRPRDTHEWLVRRRVDGYLHVREGDEGDMRRVARLLSGNAVGLALGGGGARGFAHLGVIRALREANVPIDIVGGTSMGSIIAAQYAMGLRHAETVELNRRLARTRPFAEYTLPLTALVRGRRLERGAKELFGETRIEDLWIGYFAVSASLNTTEMVVHDTGSVWFATRASGSLPGILSPVHHGRNLLVDGGVVNNLPGDVARARGAGHVIAVDVSPEEDLTVSEHGAPSQWDVLLSRALPFLRRAGAPTILDILMRATMLGSAGRTYAVRRDADLYLRPPVDRFGLLEFERLDEIVEAGYRYAKTACAAWTGPTSDAP